MDGRRFDRTIIRLTNFVFRLRATRLGPGFLDRIIFTPSYPSQPSAPVRLFDLSPSRKADTGTGKPETRGSKAGTGPMFVRKSRHILLINYLLPPPRETGTGQILASQRISLTFVSSRIREAFFGPVNRGPESRRQIKGRKLRDRSTVGQARSGRHDRTHCQIWLFLWGKLGLGGIPLYGLTSDLSLSSKGRRGQAKYRA
jgi:hypothetical protein